MLTRRIPSSSGESIPIIGLGTWQTFDVGNGIAERARLVRVSARRRSLSVRGAVAGAAHRVYYSRTLPLLKRNVSALRRTLRDAQEGRSVFAKIQTAF